MKPDWLALALAGSIAALAASPAAAQASDDAALRAVSELATLNGQALACRDAKAAQRAKALMLAHAPKTPRYASVFEDGTQQSFLATTRNQGACPDAAVLAVRLEVAARQLQNTVVGTTHAAQTAGDEVPLHSMPRYLLQGPRGGAVTSDDFRGRFQLITFGFTSCPDVCPTTLLEMQQVLALLGERALRLQPIFVTIDPQRDTPVVLDAYAAAFDKRILALGGSEALVRRAADGFNVRYRKVQEPGASAEAYTMEHSAGLYLLGPDGQLVERVAYGTPAREIAARIEVWMAAEAVR